MIQQGIDLRGFFLLIDDRIKLICGDDCEKTDDPFLRFAAVNAFAEKHRWRAQTYKNKIMFWPIIRSDQMQPKPDVSQSMKANLLGPEFGKLARITAKGNVVFETNLANSHRHPSALGPSIAFLGADITDLEDRCAAIHHRMTLSIASPS